MCREDVNMVCSEWLILLLAGPSDRLYGAAAFNYVHIARDHCRVTPTFSQVSMKSEVNDPAINDSKDIGTSGLTGSTSGRFINTFLDVYIYITTSHLYISATMPVSEKIDSVLFNSEVGIPEQYVLVLLQKDSNVHVVLIFQFFYIVVYK